MDITLSEVKEKLIQAFFGEGLIQSESVLPPANTYHCSSCSCYKCQRAKEDCVCQSNEIIQILDKVLG